ncbi:hypothetical protein EBZ70_12245, partial [bacterium]|nr:hypothetical protein [bacterium]
GNLALAGGAVTVSQGGNSDYSGTISGTGTSLTKAGAGTLTLTGNNTHSGGTTVSGGTLAISADGNLGAVTTADSLNALTQNGGAINTGVTQATSATGNPDAVTPATTANVLTQSGGATNTGVTQTTSATGNLGAVTPATNINSLTLDGGTLRATANMTLNADRSIKIGPSGGTFETDSDVTVSFPGTLSASGNITKTGAGTLVLSGNYIFYPPPSPQIGAKAIASSTTTINAGTLVLQTNAPNIGTSVKGFYGFTGPGTLAIEPIDAQSSYSGISQPVTLSQIAPAIQNLGGFRLGKSVDSGDIVVDTAISAANQTYIGGNVTVNLPAGNSAENARTANQFTVQANSIKIASDVTTTGAQSYTGNLQVGSDVSLTSDGGGISILGAVSGLSIQPTLLYETKSPSRLANGTIAYSPGYGLVAGDAAELFKGPIERITYRMELTRAGTTNFAEASFDAWSGATVASLRIPDDAGDRNLVQQRIVNNLSVTSNVTGSAATALVSSGVTTGSAKTGSLEIWSYNYDPKTSSLLSSAGLQSGSGGTYDFDDTPGPNINGHGSFQVHNLTDRQTIMAWNMHRAGGPAEIGFGNGLSGSPDWTNTSKYGNEINANKAQWKLQISVSGGTPSLNINAGTGAVNIAGATSNLRTLTIASDAANSSIAGAITGSTSLVKQGTGTLTLTGNNRG